MLIISTCVYLREGDHHEQELHQQAVHKQEVATIETPSMQHELISKRTYKGRWPKVFFRAVRRGGGDGEEESEEGQN